jgi:hypothetical protein
LRDADLFTTEHLLARPLLAAIDHPGPRPAVLLIDEVDRADDEFEAFLFELLAESAVTIPELGTRRAVLPPVAVLTSNRTRDLHDALKRRCLYHWIATPTGTASRRSSGAGCPPRPAGWPAGSPRRCTGCAAWTCSKPPGVAEAISWATALHVLGVSELDATAAERTLGAVLKYDEDAAVARERGLAALVGHA